MLKKREKPNLAAQVANRGRVFIVLYFQLFCSFDYFFKKGKNKIGFQMR